MKLLKDYKIVTDQINLNAEHLITYYEVRINNDEGKTFRDTFNLWCVLHHDSIEGEYGKISIELSSNCIELDIKDTIEKVLKEIGMYEVDYLEHEFELKDKIDEKQFKYFIDNLIDCINEKLYDNN